MTHGRPYLNCLEIYRKHFGRKFIKKHSNSKWTKEADAILRSSAFRPYNSGEAFFSGYGVGSTFKPLSGVIMENVNEAFDESRKDIEKSAETLQQSYNELIKIHNLLAPQLVKVHTDMGNKRRALMTEVKLSISLMKDIRKFFLEKEHIDEIERIKEFCDVCERLRSLITDGTMDTITDSILKLEGVT
jgi:hypothetical protein